MKKTILFLLFPLILGCVVINTKESEEQTFSLSTIETPEGTLVHVLTHDSVPIFLSKDIALESCLLLGDFFVMMSNPKDSTNEEILFFQDTILKMIRPFPVLGGWSGWEEDILYIYPNISSRMVYVVLDMKEKLSSNKKTRVVRTYWINFDGEPEPLKQTPIKRGFIYKGDLESG